MKQFWKEFLNDFVKGLIKETSEKFLKVSQKDVLLESQESWNPDFGISDVFKKSRGIFLKKDTHVAFEKT